MKKILAILLTVCMVIWTIPATVFATDEGGQPEKPELTANDITISENVLYNGEEQKPTVTVKNESDTSHYTVEYSPNEVKDAKEYTVTVTISSGCDKYKENSTATVKYNIIPVDFTENLQIDVSPSFTSDDIKKTGDALKNGKTLTVKQDGKIIKDTLYTWAAEYDKTAKNFKVTVNGTANGDNVIGGERIARFNAVKTLNASNCFISPKQSGGKNSDTISAQTYTGEAIKPKLYLYYTDDNKTYKVLTENVDFRFVYSNNITAGSVAEVTIEGMNGYVLDSTSEVKKGFEITTKQITNSMLSIKDINVNETPETIVKNGSKTLQQGTDYTLKYKDYAGNEVSSFTTVGTYIAIVTGTGNYAGEASKEFEVSQTLDGIGKVEVDTKTTYYYTGGYQTPTVDVYNSNNTTKYNKPYEIKYRDANGNYVSPKNAGTYEIVIVGTGSNVGTKVLADKFTINAVELKAKTTTTPYPANYATITGLDSYYSYANKPVEPTFNVYWNKSTTALKKGTDYTVRYTNNTYVGTGTITVTFMGNFAGTITQDFKIQRGNELSDFTVYVPTIADQTYTGSYIKPYISVYYGGATATTARTLLTENVHYTLTYTSNIYPGTATVTITGKGQYAGTVTKSFKIKYNLSNATVTTTPTSYAYDGIAKRPAVTVKVGTRTVPASDYDVTYLNNTNVGTATVTVTAKKYGDAMGSKTAYFTITGKDGIITPEYATFSKKTTKSKPFAIRMITNTTDGTGYSYTSSDTSVATVAANGIVTVKGCGKAVITVTTTGNKAYNPATATVTITVKPTKGIITSLTSTARGKLVVKYKKESPNADYYQIRYGRAGEYTVKTIKNSTALTGKSTIKGLQSGKKYYVKVRGVKELADGTILYGAWSNSKNTVVK